MSAVANPVSGPTVATSSRLARLWRSSVGLKIVMAVTGVILSGFVLVHMAGNLQVFQGEKALDDYAKLLRTEPALLWLARLVLLGSVGLHIAAWLVLLGRNRRARPVAYSKATHRESSFASRSMRWTGPLLLAFIVYHILHMTTGTVHPSFREGGRLSQPGHRVAGGTRGDHLRAGDGGARVSPLARHLEPVPDPGGRAGPLSSRSGAGRRRSSPWWSCSVSSRSRS